MTACEACNGEGQVFADRWSRWRGHYTVQLPCPACGDAGADADDAGLDTAAELAEDR